MAFHFKQFNIRQDQCAMKVSTDGILLGAWASHPHCRTILDIGSGTGLLSLMLAQRYPQAQITAIEIETKAAQQCQENVGSSPWPERIKVVQGDIRSYQSEENFDMIVCNPPYFPKAQEDQSMSLKIARHQIKLDWQTLFQSVSRLINPQASFHMIGPIEALPAILEAAHLFSFSLIKKIQVSYSPDKSPKRYLLSFSKVDGQCEEEQLIIQLGGANEYSHEFIQLTRDFYAFMP